MTPILWQDCTTLGSKDKPQTTSGPPAQECDLFPGEGGVAPDLRCRDCFYEFGCQTLSLADVMWRREVAPGGTATTLPALLPPVVFSSLTLASECILGFMVSCFQ